MTQLTLGWFKVGSPTAIRLIDQLPDDPETARIESIDRLEQLRPTEGMSFENPKLCETYLLVPV